MRLKPIEVQAMINSINKSLDLREGKLYLFGSRVDDNLLGGDIDLLLVVDKLNITQAKDKKYIILSDIKHQIGDQKIDLAICTPDKLTTDVFFSNIITQAMLLHAWPS